MKLFELMALGDDNMLGRLLYDGRKNMEKFVKDKDKEVSSAAKNLIAAIDSLEVNTNVLQTDGYSMMNYLQQIANPKVGKRTLLHVSDALGSYDDGEGE